MQSSVFVYKKLKMSPTFVSKKMETKNDNSNVSPLTREELQEELKKLKGELVLALDRNAKKEAKEKEERDRKWVFSLLKTYVSSLSLTEEECKISVGYDKSEVYCRHWPHSMVKNDFRSMLEYTPLSTLVKTLAIMQGILETDNLTKEQYSLLHLILTMLPKTLTTDVLLFHLGGKISITEDTMLRMYLMLEPCRGLELGTNRD